MLEEQKNLLKLIKEIDSICRENNITYYAAGGTVIGAVRHSGFIPWDDDIDIYMTRDNWIRFLEVTNKMNLQDRAVECWENNLNFRNLLGRYMDLGTTDICKYHMYGDSHMGQLVDVFVLDKVKDTEECCRQYINDVMVASDIAGETIMYSNRLESCDDYEYYLDVVNSKGKLATLQMFDQKLNACDDDCEDYCYMLRWGGIPHKFPKSMFGEPKYVKFEDIELPMPSNISSYLNLLYGVDWMYIPQHSEQIVHGSLINTKYPYEIYKSSILEAADKSFIEKNIERKKKVFKSLPLMHRASNRMVELEGQYIKDILLNMIEKNGFDIQAMHEAEDYDALNSIFRVYINGQLSLPYIGNGTFGGYYKKVNPTFIDIGDEYYSVVIDLIMHSPRSAKVERLIAIREQCCDRPLSPAIQRTKDIFEAVKTAMVYYEEGQYDRVESLIDEIDGEYTNKMSLLFKLILLGRKLNNVSCMAQYRKLVEFGLEKYPENGDLLKLKGDLCAFEGDYSEMAELYTNAILNTRNGIFINDMAAGIKNHEKQAIDYMETIRMENYSLWNRMISAWMRNCSLSDDFIVYYIANSEDSLDKVLKNKVIRERIIEDKDSKAIKCAIMNTADNWTEANIDRAYALSRKAKNRDDLFDCQNPETEIDKYQMGMFYIFRGERKRGYTLINELLYSTDPYITERIGRLIRREAKYMANTVRNKRGRRIEQNMEIVFPGKTVAEVVEIYKMYGIIPEDYEMSKNYKEFASIFKATKEIMFNV